MKKIKIKIEREGWIDECPYCGYSIKGSTQEEVKFNMKRHINSKNCNGRENKNAGHQVLNS